MWKKIDDFVEKYHMLSEGDHILIGLSGGADSILLTRYLLERRERYDLHLYVVHINHLLRGEEACRDENFVADFCRNWKLPYRSIHKDVASYAGQNHYSLEEAGRILRYECFNQAAKEWQCQKIALAHHGTDLTETMLFRMIRGTGPEGLAGILPVYQNRIRPLLSLEKEEILSLLSQLQQPYVVDSSNERTDYSRNYIRHQILPLMRQMNPQVISHFLTLSSQLKEQNSFVREQMDHLYEQVSKQEDGIRISRQWLGECDDFVKKEMIRRMLFQAGQHRRDISSLHVELVLDLLKKESGQRLDLPYDMMAILEEKDFVLAKRADLISQSSKRKPVESVFRISCDLLERGQVIYLNLLQPLNLQKGEFSPVTYRLELIEDISQENLKKDCEEYFDYDIIKGDLCFRCRRPGDYLIMDHCGRRKKLNRYLIDEKIPARWRDQLFLFSRENHILWIPGGRRSENTKVTRKSRHILKISMISDGDSCCTE